MNQEKHNSSNSVADEVERSVKEKSEKAQDFIKGALDSFEDFIYQLISIRPKDYRSKDFTPTRDFTPTQDSGSYIFSKKKKNIDGRK